MRGALAAILALTLAASGCLVQLPDEQEVSEKVGVRELRPTSAPAEAADTAGREGEVSLDSDSTPSLLVGRDYAEIQVPDTVRGQVEGWYWPAGSDARLPVLQNDEGSYFPFLTADRSYHYSIALGQDSAQAYEGSFRTLPSFASSSAPILYPGSGLGFCTVGFLLRDATNATLYFVTAGHCFDGTGATVYAGNPRVAVGTVVERDFGSPNDYALVEIFESARGLVSPELAHFTGPVGHAEGDDVVPGSTVCFHGYGRLAVVFPLKQERCGVLRGYGPEGQAPRVDLTGDAFQGDSGAPLIDYETGAAVAILSSAIYGVNVIGMSVCSILVKTHQLGYTLALVPASHSPPEAEVPLIPREVPYPLPGLGSEMECTWPYRVV